MSFASSPIRSSVRTLLFVSWTLAVLPVVFLCWLLKLDRARARCIQFFYSVSMRITGVTVVVEGTLDTTRPLMLVANHTSYLDIFVLGTLVPLSFTPKKEIRSWPVIGFFCVLADCVFVERKPSELTQAKAQMERRLDKDKVLCLFPEGTTSDGNSVLPFKSGFLSLAEEYEMPVQPASIVYTHIGNQPVPNDQRELLAWVGETVLFGHLLRFFGFPGVRAQVMLHPALSFKHYEDRKGLTKAAENIIKTQVVKVREQHNSSFPS